MRNIILWIAVLPGSILCAALSTFFVHLVLYQTLTGSGIIEPYPQAPERLLVPFAAALALVWAGSRIAPLRKLETAIALFGVLLLLFGAAIAFSLTGARIGSSQITLQLHGFALAAAIVGAFVGVYLARRDSRESEAK